MTKLTKTRFTRTAVAVSAATIGLMATSPTAFAAGEVTGENVPLSQSPVAPGYNEIFGPGTTYAGAFTVRMEDGEIVRAFCVEVGVPFPSEADGMVVQAGPLTTLRTGGNPARLPQALWVGSNATMYDSAGNPTGPTVGTPLSLADGFDAASLQAAENASVQLAIWNIVNSRDISATADPVMLARALDLVDQVDGADNTIGTSDDNRIELAPVAFDMTSDWESSGDSGNIITTVTQTDADGQVAPTPNVTVTLSTTSDFDLNASMPGIQQSVDIVTDAAGIARASGLTAPASDVNVTSTADITVDSGAIMTPPDAANGSDQQQIITVEGSQLTRSAALVIPAQIPATTVAPTTTLPGDVTATTVPPTTAPGATPTTVPASPTPTTPTAATDVGEPEDLPTAGPSLGMIAVVAAAIAGSVGLFMATRRRTALADGTSDQTSDE